MTWLALALSQQAGTAVTPVDAATSSITGYIVGFGPLGVIALAMAYLMFRGWRLIPPAREAEIRTGARDDGRADLLKELDRVLAEKVRIEEERDDALKIAQTQLVPLLISFNATVSALLPLLQELVSRREGHDRRNGLP